LLFDSKGKFQTISQLWEEGSTMFKFALILTAAVFALFASAGEAKAHPFDVECSGSLWPGDPVPGFADYVAKVKKEKNNDKRFELLKKLAETCHWQTRPFFEQVLRTDPYEDNRCLAASALAAAGNEENLPALYRAFVKESGNKGIVVRIFVGRAFARIGSPKALPFLHAVLDNKEHSDVLDALTDALAVIGSPSSIPYLKVIVDSNRGHDSFMKGNRAIQAMGSIGHASSVPFLTRVLTSPLYKTRPSFNGYTHSAIAALGAIGHQSAAPVLVRKLKAKEKAVRGLAAAALGKLRLKRTAPALHRVVLKDKDSWVRRSAAMALGHIASRGSVFTLTRVATKDSDPKVRAAAIWALGQIGSKKSLNVLSAIGDRDMHPSVQRAVVMARCNIDPVYCEGAFVHLSL